MEVSPECGERSPTGKSVGVLEVEKEDIEERIPSQGETKRERTGRAAAHSYRETEKRVLCFVDKTEIRLLGLEKKRKQPAMKSDAGSE
ncbi:hypothetical protein BHE74_00027532 [Ensete ventricosum]|nr:hypothetical protein BHE74_00027532 [Ensete ventricosum]